jgi:hypothetical protein
MNQPHLINWGGILWSTITTHSLVLGPCSIVPHLLHIVLQASLILLWWIDATTWSAVLTRAITLTLMMYTKCWLTQRRD